MEEKVKLKTSDVVGIVVFVLFMLLVAIGYVVSMVTMMRLSTEDVGEIVNKMEFVSTNKNSVDKGFNGIVNDSVFTVNDVFAITFATNDTSRKSIATTNQIEDAGVTLIAQTSNPPDYSVSDNKKWAQIQVKQKGSILSGLFPPYKQVGYVQAGLNLSLALSVDERNVSFPATIADFLNFKIGAPIKTTTIRIVSKDYAKAVKDVRSFVRDTEYFKRFVQLGNETADPFTIKVVASSMNDRYITVNGHVNITTIPDKPYVHDLTHYKLNKLTCNYDLKITKKLGNAPIVSGTITGKALFYKRNKQQYDYVMTFYEGSNATIVIDGKKHNIKNVTLSDSLIKFCSIYDKTNKKVSIFKMLNRL